MTHCVHVQCAFLRTHAFTNVARPSAFLLPSDDGLLPNAHFVNDQFTLYHINSILTYCGETLEHFDHGYDLISLTPLCVIKIKHSFNHEHVIVQNPFDSFNLSDDAPELYDHHDHQDESFSLILLNVMT